MGNIHDIIENSNRALITTHNNSNSNSNNNNNNANTVSNKAKFIEYNKRGYPVYNVNGRRLVHLGFYVPEQKLEEYYNVAKEVLNNGMGDGQTIPGQPKLKEANVNSFIHYAADFYCNNFKIAGQLKPKDLISLLKQMPKLMRS